jgi:two-component system, NarL family, nitrate/nitrite response regulator NarL
LEVDRRRGQTAVGLEGAPGPRATIMVVDDYRMFAEALGFLFADLPFDVVGIATTGREALDSVEDLAPSLILLDLRLPDMDGLEVGRRVLEKNPEAKIILLTAEEDPRIGQEALRNGFHGYLTKQLTGRRLIASIEAVLNGQVIIPRKVAAAITGSRGDNPHLLLAASLTQREREVLGLLVEGATGRDIARRLMLRPNTVRTHVQNVLTKLQVHSRLEAASTAVRYGIVKVPDYELVDEA